MRRLPHVGAVRGQLIVRRRPEGCGATRDPPDRTGATAARVSADRGIVPRASASVDETRHLRPVGTNTGLCGNGSTRGLVYMMHLPEGVDVFAYSLEATRLQKRDSFGVVWPHCSEAFVVAKAI